MYSKEPVLTLKNHLQYLCKKLKIDSKNNTFSQYSGLLEQLFLDYESIWSLDSSVFTINIFQEHEFGLGICTILELNIEIRYVNILGEFTGSENVLLHFFTSYEHGDLKELSFTINNSNLNLIFHKLLFLSEGHRRWHRRIKTNS